MPDNAARTLALRRWEVHPAVERDYVCQQCGVTFTAKAEAKTCSVRCRQRMFEAKKRKAKEQAA